MTRQVTHDTRNTIIKTISSNAPEQVLQSWLSPNSCSQMLCHLGHVSMPSKPEGPNLRAVSRTEALSQVLTSAVFPTKACRHWTVASRTLVRGCRNNGHSRGISCPKELAEALSLLPKTTVRRCSTLPAGMQAMPSATSCSLDQGANLQQELSCNQVWQDSNVM